ncbi:MAG TPA: bacillithiol biosynthesis cysteine-adding enzyme BshC [Longimicrobiales bacterium]|nr:bacillithiol biosynthesis cysteine-adding enzyme BshC [Longimicrobiales bacterium]
MSKAEGPELLRNPAGAGFAAAYEAGVPALAPFYAGWPWDPAAYERKAVEISARFDAAARARLRTLLRAVSGEARGRLEGVARGEGFVVTTGQQAGLLGGPLFTLYKALSAVALADALQERLGVPVLPVFWVASEDHDWAEVKDVHLLDTANRLQRVELADPVGGAGDADGPGPSMARRKLDDGIHDVFRRLEEILPPTDFRDALLAGFRDAYAPGESVSDAFERLLATLLAATPLALIQASDAELKRASVPVLRAELENGAAHEAAVRRTTAAFSAAGYEPRVAIADGAENVFYESDGGRERLVRDGDGWVTRGRGARLSRKQALEELEAHPVRFSPNVVLRPVVESAVLPTLAYVGGPAEVRYFAQTGCLFEAHGVGMPLVMPRASLTVVEGKTRKVLEKFALDVEDLGVPPQELAARVLADEMPPEVDAALKRVRGAIAEGYAALGEAVKQIDPTLKGPIGSARSATLSELGDLEKRVMRGLKSQNEIALDQIEKARVNLFPTGKPQERVLNPLQYLVRYGDEFMEQVRAAVDFELAGEAPEWTGVRCP